MKRYLQQTGRWGVSLVVVAGLGWLAGRLHQPSLYRDLREARQRLENRKNELERIVERLTSEYRVAEVDVLENRPDAQGNPQTVLRFVEFDRQDRPLPEKLFTVPGQVIFFDALVIKFADDESAANDPLRGRSLALFRRIYGETQPPIEGAPIDPAGDVPSGYRIAPTITESERQLWDAFWSYATDPAKARAAGVRVAQGQAVYAPLTPGETWTVTLENDGGLNLVKQTGRQIPVTADRTEAGGAIASGSVQVPGS